jgi:hypothetical protein
MGLAELLITRARPLFPRYDLAWPSDLARVTARRVQEQLGLDISSWCY